CTKMDQFLFKGILALLLSCFVKTDTTKPNIVFILTDDQDVELGGMIPMVKTLKLLGNGGMTFQNMFTVSPLCCPSRSSILTGNYVHNHEAVNNSISGNCSSTTWQKGPEKNTLATQLQAQGYYTFFAGKYLNQYGDPSVGGAGHIPPGWDDWNGLIYNSVYYNYNISVNGVVETHHDDYYKDYLTDLIHNKSIDFLKVNRGNDEPFFMMLSTPACHRPFDSAPQYVKNFTTKKAPRDKAFNTKAKNKHWLIQQAPHPMSNDSMDYVDDAFRKRWRTLLSVDDMVSDLITTLENLTLLNSTFIFFASDNGFHLGQFSLPNDKRQMYEFDIRVPLLVRGPGVKAGSKSLDPVLTIDLMPTFVHLASGSEPTDVDGTSFVPLLLPKKKKKKNAAWRKDMLIEHQGEYLAKGFEDCSHTEFLNECWPNCVCEDAYNNTYSCLRSLSPTDNYILCQFSDAQTVSLWWFDYTFKSNDQHLAYTCITLRANVHEEANL
ncbi:putative N-acetylglucosamine-6-sulfatase-like, partial [Apostichopus japonicus]